MSNVNEAIALHIKMVAFLAAINFQNGFPRLNKIKQHGEAKFEQWHNNEVKSFCTESSPQDCLYLITILY